MTEKFDAEYYKNKKFESECYLSFEQTMEKYNVPPNAYEYAYEMQEMEDALFSFNIFLLT